MITAEAVIPFMVVLIESAKALCFNNQLDMILLMCF